jgi:hypothetical protein
VPGAATGLSLANGTLYAGNASGAAYSWDGSSWSLQGSGAGLGGGNLAQLQGGTLYVLTPGGGRTRALANVQWLTPAPNHQVSVQVGPFLQATLSVQVGAGGTLTLAFNQVQLRLGAALSGYIDPLVREIQTATRPLQHTADFLLARIPVLSDVSNRFGGPDLTLAGLIGAATGSSAVRDFATAVTVIDSLNPNFLSDATVDLGSFTETVSAGGSTSLQQVTGVRSFFDQLGSSAAAFFRGLGAAGLHLSVLDDTSNFFRVLAGQNVTLFTYTPPALNLDLPFTQRIAYVPVLGPVGFDVLATEAFHVHGGLTLGMDTSGLLSGNVLAGFFVQNATLGLDASFTLSGYAGVPDVIEAGVSGTLTVHIGASLRGADASGRVYGTQLVTGAAGLALSGSVSGHMSLDFVHISIDRNFIGDIFSGHWEDIVRRTTEHILYTPDATFWTF